MDQPVFTHILFVEKYRAEPQPGVDWPWNTKLINPTKEELEVFNYINSKSGVELLVVNSEQHYSAYDHDDPELDTNGCICELDDRNLDIYPKLYKMAPNTFLATGYNDIMALKLENI